MKLGERKEEQEGKKNTEWEAGWEEKKENHFHTTDMKASGISSLKRLTMWDQAFWIHSVLPKHSNAFHNFIMYLKS